MAQANSLDDLVSRMMGRTTTSAALVIGFRGGHTLVGHMHDTQVLREMNVIPEMSSESFGVEYRNFTRNRVKQCWTASAGDTFTKTRRMQDFTRGKLESSGIYQISRLINAGYISSVYAADAAESIYCALSAQLRAAGKSIAHRRPWLETISALEMSFPGPSFFDVGELFLLGIEDIFDESTKRRHAIDKALERETHVLLWGWCGLNRGDAFEQVHPFNLSVLGRSRNFIEATDFQAIDDPDLPGTHQGSAIESDQLIALLAERLCPAAKTGSPARAPGLSAHVVVPPPRTGSFDSSLIGPQLALKLQHAAVAERGVTVIAYGGAGVGSAIMALTSEVFDRRNGKGLLLLAAPPSAALTILAVSSNKGQVERLMLNIDTVQGDHLGSCNPVLDAVYARRVREPNRFTLLLVPLAWGGNAVDKFRRDKDCRVIEVLPKELLSAVEIQSSYKATLDRLAAGAADESDDNTITEAAEDLSHATRGALAGRFDVEAQEAINSLMSLWRQGEDRSEDLPWTLEQSIDRAHAQIIQPLTRWRASVGEDFVVRLVRRRNADRPGSHDGSAVPDISITVQQKARPKSPSSGEEIDGKQP